MNKVQAPKLRFKEFTDIWEAKLLKSVAKIYDGTHQTPQYVDKGIPFYSVEQVTSDNFDDTKFIAPNIYEKETKKVKVENGDILMTRIGDVGTAKYIGWDVRASFYVSLSLIKCKKDVSAKFLTQYINSSFFQHDLWKKTIHVAFPKKVNLGNIGECSVMLPKEQEQSKIATFLNNVDEYIRNLKSQKEELEKYKKGMVQKIFSQEIRFKDENGKDFPNWEKLKLSNIASFRRGSFPQPYGLPKWYNGKNGAPFVQVYDVGDNMKLKEVTKQKISELAKPSSVFVKKGSIVLTIQGSIGRVAITHYDTFIDRTLLVFQTFKKPVNMYFFAYALLLLFEIEKTKAPGGTIKTITKERLSDFIVKVPTIKEQEVISQILRNIDDLLAIKQKQIEHTKIWKKGLMQEMFI